MSAYKFLGCSVVNFSENIGWNGSQSDCRITLIADTRDGDYFQPYDMPDQGIGLPFTFSADSHTFGGILQNWVEDNSPSGKPHFTVNLVDPRKVLEFAPVITGVYNGPVLPNMLNVFGYLENLNGFGGSGTNEAGMPWSNVLTALNSLLSTPTSSYGGFINYKGVNYTVDLSGLPGLPIWFRMPTPSLSLLDCIQQVCDASNLDYFIIMDTTRSTSSLVYINVVTVSRIEQLYAAPWNNTINRFIAANNVVPRSSRGYELRDEVNSTFLIGGEKKRLYAVQGTSAKPFFGLDQLGNPIFCDNLNLNTSVNLNAASIKDIIGSDTYACTIAEMRASLHSKDSWYYFMQARRNQPKYQTWYDHVVTEYNDVDFNDPRSTEFLNNLIDNPPVNYLVEQIDDMYHVIGGRDLPGVLPSLIKSPGTNADYISVDENGNPVDSDGNILDPALLEDRKPVLRKNWRVNIWQNIQGRFADKKQLIKLRESLAADQLRNMNYFDRVYEFVRQTAQNHLGKSFLIPITWVYRTVEQETGLIRYSEVPTDGGYVDEGGTAIGLNSINEVIFQNENGTFRPLAKSQDPELDYFFAVQSGGVIQNAQDAADNFRAEVYTHASVDGDIITYLGIPYVKVTLNTPLYALQDHMFGDLKAAANVLGGRQIQEPLRLSNQLAQIGVKTITQSNTTRQLDKLKADFFSSIKLYPRAIIPQYFFIALESRIETYGPWYLQGAKGRVRFEQDRDLVPWNYNGYNLMNAAASAKLSQGFGFLQTGEQGSIDLIGIPTFSIGDVLLSGGSRVAGIDVSVSSGEIKTVLRLASFTPTFGTLSKSFTDSLRRSAISIQQQRHKIKQYLADINQANTQANANLTGFAVLNPAGEIIFTRRQTPHTVLFGGCEEDERNPYVPTLIKRDNDVEETPQEDLSSPHVGNSYSRAMTAKYDEVLRLINVEDPDEYKKQAMMSLEGLIRPFDTNYTTQRMGHFVDPVRATGAESTVEHLNPFRPPHDLQVLTYGDSYPTYGVNTFDYGTGDHRNSRGFCLKGPVIITGPGYGIDGQFYPTGVTGISGDYPFDSGRVRAREWPTGPLEMYYDHYRGVWSAGAKILGVLTTDIPANSGATGVVLQTGSLISDQFGAVALYGMQGYTDNIPPRDPSGMMRIMTRDNRALDVQVPVFNFFNTNLTAGTRVMASWVNHCARLYIDAAAC